MKRAVRFTLALTLFAGLLLPGLAKAEEARPIQLSLVPSVQLFSEQTAIHGVRLAIVGRNSEVQGLDFGLGLLTTGPFTGVALGIANVVDGTAAGLQWSFINYTKGDVQGMQWGFYNQASSMQGIQWGLINFDDADFQGWQWGAANLVQNGHSKGLMVGFVNMTEDMNGLQFGLVNMTNNMHGLQIGLVNVIKSKEKLPILPIVNWVF